MSIEDILRGHRYTWETSERNASEAHNAHLAALIRAALTGDDVVEAAARGIAMLEPGEEWGRDDEYYRDKRASAVAALAAAAETLGGER